MHNPRTAMHCAGRPAHRSDVVGAERLELPTFALYAPFRPQRPSLYASKRQKGRGNPHPTSCWVIRREDLAGRRPKTHLASQARLRKSFGAVHATRIACQARDLASDAPREPPDLEDSCVVSIFDPGCAILRTREATNSPKSPSFTIDLHALAPPRAEAL
jgi:hypothetical protein